MRVKTFTTWVLAATIGSGCCSQLPEAPITLPPRPVLTPLTLEQQQSIPEDALAVVIERDLALKAYARKLEARIIAHDETL